MSLCVKVTAIVSQSHPQQQLGKLSHALNSNPRPAMTYARGCHTGGLTFKHTLQTFTYTPNNSW